MKRHAPAGCDNAARNARASGLPAIPGAIVEQRAVFLGAILDQIKHRQFADEF
jgi:hypothetical protein